MQWWYLLWRPVWAWGPKSSVDTRTLASPWRAPSCFPAHLSPSDWHTESFANDFAGPPLSYFALHCKLAVALMVESRTNAAPLTLVFWTLNTAAGSSHIANSESGFRTIPWFRLSMCELSCVSHTLWTYICGNANYSFLFRFSFFCSFYAVVVVVLLSGATKPPSSQDRRGGGVDGKNCGHKVNVWTILLFRTAQRTIPGQALTLTRSSRAAQLVDCDCGSDNDDKIIAQRRNISTTCRLLISVSFSFASYTASVGSGEQHFLFPRCC